MALTYRSPLEENLVTYDANVQAAITSTSASYYKDLESENFKFFNFHLRAEAKKNLISAGIYVSPNAATPHSHPACKTLENHFLYTVLPPLLDNTFFFIGIKNQKLNLIKTRNSNLSLVQKVNRYVTSLDAVRYGPDFVVRSTPEHVGLKRHGIEIEGPTLKDLVPPLMLKSAKRLFLHDELHYWTHRELITFLELLKPEVIYATMVFPPEILAGATYSLNKWCYLFEINGKDLFFYPDGVHAEGYQQPVKGGYLLKTSKLILGNGDFYNVDIVQSKFAHHLVAITRGKSVGPTFRTFGNFCATSCKGLEPMCRNIRQCFPVSFEVVSRVYMYLRTLKKPDCQSAMAKLRQIVPEPSGLEIKFLEDFADLVINTKTTRTMLKPDRVAIFLHSWCKDLPKFIADKISKVREISLDDFVSMMEPFSFQIKLESVDWNYDCFFDLFSCSESDFGVDVVNLIEERFFTGSVNGLADRHSSPISMKSGCALPKAPLLIINVQVLQRFVVRVLLLECLGPFVRSISNVSCRALIQNKLLAQKNLCVPTKLCLRKVLEADWMSMCIKKAVSVYARRIRRVWMEGRLMWFLDLARGYQRQLTMFPHYAKTFGDLDTKYRPIVSEAITFDRKRLSRRAPPFAFVARQVPHTSCDLAIKDSNFCNGGHTSTIPSTSQCSTDASSTSLDDKCEEPTYELPVPIEEKPEVPDSIEAEEFKIPRALTPFCCLCGICMPVFELPYADINCFRTQERLHNRSAGWYSVGGIDYHYNGGNHTSLGWPSWLVDWLNLNGIGDDYYNCCLYQVYDANGKIGFHADDEEIFEPDTKVLTVNLKGRATFSICCAQGATSYDLAENVCFEMPKNFQITHRHAVGHLTPGRSSVTFRKLRSFSSSEGTAPGVVDPLGDHQVENENSGLVIQPPSQTDDGISTKSCEGASESHSIDLSLGTIHYSLAPENIKFRTLPVRGDGNCFWYATALSLKINPMELKKNAAKFTYSEKATQNKWLTQQGDLVYAEDEAILAAANASSSIICVFSEDTGIFTRYTPNRETRNLVYLHHQKEHFQTMLPYNNCVAEAIAQSLQRKASEILRVMLERLSAFVDEELWSGEGVALEDLDIIFETFDIAAMVEVNGEKHCYNADGRVPASFVLQDQHLTFSGKPVSVDASIFQCERREHSVTAASCAYIAAVSSKFTYTATFHRAQILAKSFESGCTGVLNSELFNKQEYLLKGVEEAKQGRILEIFGVLGTFGAGKSTIFGTFLRKNPGKTIFYVSPRKALADEFRRKYMCSSLRVGGKKNEKELGRLETRSWVTCTFEVFLKKYKGVKPGSAVILDEMQLYPPGYLDLIAHLLPEGVVLIIGGDPCQSDYDNAKDRVWLSSIKSDMEVLLEGAEYNFNCLSRRFLNSNFMGRLPCKINAEDCLPKPEPHLLFTGLEEMVQLEDEYKKVFLVSSFDEKKIVEAYFTDPTPKIYTFGESTGLNFKKGTLVITNVSQFTSENRWLTALSRFSDNLCLVNLVNCSWSALNEMYKGRALQLFLSRTSTSAVLHKMLPGKASLIEGFANRVGRSEGQFEEKAAGDPWLKGLIDLGQQEDCEEEEIELEELQEEWFKTHLPQAEMESVRARWVHRLLAKEHREVRMGMMVSEQFTDEYALEEGKVLTNAAERFEAIYPRHRANDTVTFIMAVKKRLRFSNPAKEQAKLLQAQNYGKFLLDEFLKKIPLNSAHDAQMMAQAKQAFEEKKMSKSAATIENHSGRSCRDWLIDVGLIFSKSQLCTKFPNRFREAKAAQSIVCFQHEVLCRFAPYMRYIEMKLHAALPERYYIHSGKGLEELNEWVKKGVFSGICTESDYEAFDASQDQYIVAFELAIMTYLGLPRDLIEDYRFIKTHLGSKLGNFAIMRFSGEASTFLFNTMANMLFTFLRYEITGNEFICFAGDDMCASTRLKLKKEHESFLSKLKLKAKVDMVDKPTFCGWHLCPDGIYKKPQLVMERICIAKEKNNLHNCIDNYAIEVSYAYRLGEKAVNRMDEEELEAFYNCVRIIVKNKHLLKSDVRELYANRE